MKRAIVLLSLLVTAVVSACAQTPVNDPIPALVSFVAPAYPRAAKDQRIMGTTITRIRVARDGSVVDTTTVCAHPVFEKYVLDALKQWRFKPSTQEHSFEVTCRFEFYEEGCEKPLTPETQVSAELPTTLRIRTGLQCIRVSNTDSKR